jgi:hypothetical protein
MFKPTDALICAAPDFGDFPIGGGGRDPRGVLLGVPAELSGESLEPPGSALADNCIGGGRAPREFRWTSGIGVLFFATFVLSSFSSNPTTTSSFSRTTRENVSVSGRAACATRPMMALSIT